MQAAFSEAKLSYAHEQCKNISFTKHFYSESLNI